MHSNVFKDGWPCHPLLSAVPVGYFFVLYFSRFNFANKHVLKEHVHAVQHLADELSFSLSLSIKPNRGDVLGDLLDELRLEEGDADDETEPFNSCSNTATKLSRVGRRLKQPHNIHTHTRFLLMPTRGGIWLLQYGIQKLNGGQWVQKSKIYVKIWSYLKALLCWSELTHFSFYRMP